MGGARVRHDWWSKSGGVTEFLVNCLPCDAQGTFNLYSLVECLTQRRRETESAEKSQKSERKERYDKKRPENFFHPIGENNYDAN